MDAKIALLKKGSKVRSEIQSKLKYDKLEAEKQYITRKGMDLAFVRRMHQERKEAETEAACEKAKVSQGWRSEEVKQEDKLGLEMIKDKLEMNRDMKKRAIFQCSEEIREIEQKIKNAYLNKDMAMQLSEKKARKMRQKCQEKDELLMMIEQEKFLEEVDIQSKVAGEQRKLKYKEDLQDQIIDKQKMKEEAFRNLLEEKSFIDDSLRTILEEDKRDEQLKTIRKQIAKEEAEAMLSAKKLWFKKEKELQEEEDRKIREYLEEKNKKEKELQEANKKKEEIRMLKKKACINMIRSFEEERLEKERIEQILLEEDTRQKEKDKARQDLEKKLRNAYEFKEITAMQMENRLKIMEEEKLEDLKFHKQLLEENNRALMHEQEELERKRQENVEYGRTLKSVMNQQHMNKLKNMEEQYNQQKLELEEIQKRRAIIDEERRKLLKEHVGNLLGYIPKGLIRTEDLPYLDPEVRKFYESPNNMKI